MLSASELRNALVGSVRLARGDPTGMVFFDRSPEGCLRSFAAALITLPGFYILLALTLTEADLARSGLGQILTVETIGYAISWTAFPLAVIPILRQLGRDDRWVDFITAYNWSAVLQTAAQLLAHAMAGIDGVAPTLGVIIVLVTLAATLVYEWFIAKTALGITDLPATGIVLLDLMLGILISTVTRALY
jgi:hypothetical protein